LAACAYPVPSGGGKGDDDKPGEGDDDKPGEGDGDGGAGDD
jgi:hypothetical protein